MDNTIIQQGRFTSDGTARQLAIRSDVDWMYVYNFTKATMVAGSEGVKYYWQRGLAANDGFVTIRNAGGTADLITTSATPTGLPRRIVYSSSTAGPEPITTTSCPR